MFESIGSPHLVVGFLVFVAAALFIDIFVAHRGNREPTLREGLLWSAIWIGLAIGFFVWMLRRFGSEYALQFLTGYVIELSLSIDNLFIFVLIFSFFAVPRTHQRRVLTYGIIGALIMRAVFIVLGSTLIQKFHWIMYIMGAILIYSGYKLFRGEDRDNFQPDQSFVFRTFRRIVPSTSEYHGDRFFARVNGKLLATPLFFVLIVVETTDLVFAVDSIPAIFGITTDPFIVFTSNIFAIIGLRSFYQVIAEAFTKLRYLNEGLALVLCFVGAEMLGSRFFHIPVQYSLLVVVVLIGGAMILSVLKNRSDPTS